MALRPSLFLFQLNTKTVDTVKGHFDACKKAHHNDRHKKPDKGARCYHRVKI